MDQRIRFCTAADGTRIAYATFGGGPGLPLVRAATWLTHLELDAESYRHWLTDLGSDRPLLRYDMRGCGLSDREADDLSLEARVSDLEAVVDTAGLDRFDLLGMSGGGPVAVEYAARHPERVAHLLLYGSYARGRARRAVRAAAGQEEADLLVSLTRVGWGRDNAAFRHVFTSLYMPDAGPAEVAAYDELQRVSASPEVAARLREEGFAVDVTAAAGRVTAPTQVLHVREDGAAPFEEGRHLAALVPGAEFVPLPGRNHILGADDPGWAAFVQEVRRFTGSGPDPAVDRGLLALTARERAVLSQVSQGLDNAAISQRLSVSPRTVERHLSNVYAKLGVSGPSARAAAAARFARRR